MSLVRCACSAASPRCPATLSSSAATCSRGGTASKHQLGPSRAQRTALQQPAWACMTAWRAQPIRGPQQALLGRATRACCYPRSQPGTRVHLGERLPQLYIPLRLVPAQRGAGRPQPLHLLCERPAMPQAGGSRGAESAGEGGKWAKNGLPAASTCSSCQTGAGREGSPLPGLRSGGAA